MEMSTMVNGDWDLGGEEEWSYLPKDPQPTLRELLGETCGQLELKTSPAAANNSYQDYEKISDIVDLLDWASSPDSDSNSNTSPVRVPDQEHLMDDANLKWDDFGGDLFDDWIHDKVDLPLLDDAVMDDHLQLEDLPGTLDPAEVVAVMLASVVGTAPSSPECVVPEMLTPPSTVESSSCNGMADDCCTMSSSDVGSYLSQPSSPEHSPAGGGPIRKRKVCVDKTYVVEDEEEDDDDEFFDEDSSPSPPPAKTKRRGGGGGKPARPDKKSRKRNQNKVAADRYRRKKKGELMTLCQEEEEMMKKNKKLRDRVAELSKEAKYLKNLMRDILKAKGVLK